VHDVLPAADTQTPDASLPAGLSHPEEGSSILDGAGSIVLDGSARLVYARYLVPYGTTTSHEADRYQNAIATAGFAATTPATNANGSAMFSIVASPNPDVLSEPCSSKRLPATSLVF
jgi:hypothetical protein